MAGFIAGTPVDLTGTTPKEVVAAPASGKQREVLAIHVHNRDTVDHTITLRKSVGASDYDDYPPVVIPSTKKAQLLLEPVVLDATNMSFKLVMAAGITTTAPRADVVVFEVP